MQSNYRPISDQSIPRVHRPTLLRTRRKDLEALLVMAPAPFDDQSHPRPVRGMSVSSNGVRAAILGGYPRSANRSGEWRLAPTATLMKARATRHPTERRLRRGETGMHRQSSGPDS